ncbi:hypothetical protein [Massilia niastensis]|nr:hypothetical protein [Massilia niastensis]
MSDPQKFVCWHDQEHTHGSLKFVMQAQRHTGRDAAILARRETA